MSIKENYERILGEIPGNVKLVVVIKGRTAEEITEAITAGAKYIGGNYVQETSELHDKLKNRPEKIEWHTIGHLQSNKINKALSFSDTIQTIDSYEKADMINQKSARLGKITNTYLEINIGEETSKHGVTPEYENIKDIIMKISKLENIKLTGLMTMGPTVGSQEELRPYFKKMKEIFDKISNLNIPNADMETLSMGMSKSYKIAIEEGSNMVRIGTAIFGERNYDN
ncbi:YggS family pyridoxal phosphate-dependent enzyme [archaeon]|jgi:PLP dependent protein|nr:YggS family pyridoxal phosphate-dependent enzyme [archaeon]